MSLPNWVMYALLSMLFEGVTSVIAKFGLKNVSGDAGLAVRTTFVFALIWLNTISFQHFKEFGGLTKKIYCFFLCRPSPPHFRGYFIIVLSKSGIYRL